MTRDEIEAVLRRYLAYGPTDHPCVATASKWNKLVDEILSIPCECLNKRICYQNHPRPSRKALDELLQDHYDLGNVQNNVSLLAQTLMSWARGEPKVQPQPSRETLVTFLDKLDACPGWSLDRRGQLIEGLLLWAQGETTKCKACGQELR